LQQAGVADDLVRAMAAKQYGQPIPGFAGVAPAVATAAMAPVNSGTGAVLSGTVQRVPNPNEHYNARLGTVDFGVGGGVFIDKNLAPAAHPAALTTTSVALHKYAAIYGEFGYTHLASGSGNLYGYNVSANAYLLDYGAGGKFTIPTGTRIVPYGTFGFGRSNLRASASVSGVGSDSAGEAAWNFNFGGGVNVFATRNVGINLDFRAYRPSKDGYGFWYERAAFGVFYQFNNKAI
jgi:hypothetical protein